MANHQHDEHAEHHNHGIDANVSLPLGDFDRALSAARQAGLDASRIQLSPPGTPQQAWKVAEIDRQWPTQVDQVALHPTSMDVLEQTNFATFPTAAKLTRWGIDLHMGVLFGLANQFILATIAAGLVVLIVWGYVMVWRKLRDTSGQRFPTVTEPWLQLPPTAKIISILIALVIGSALPVFGASLALFIVIDALRWYVKNHITARGPSIREFR